VLPNVIAPVVIAATLGVAGAIMAEAALSFLGLGVPPPAPEWGRLIADGTELIANAPWVAAAPSVVLVVTVLGLTLAGDWLRDVVDPVRRRAARG